MQPYVEIWVRGLMAINVECEFRDRGSIPSVCQITDAANLNHSLNGGLATPSLAMRY